jgi:hypothetical protein
MAVPPYPAQNGSIVTDAGQPRIPIKAMAGVSPAYPAKRRWRGL